MRDGLHRPGIWVDSNAYARLLQWCAKRKVIAEGKSVHGHMIKTEFEPEIFLQNHLVNMYGKCGTVTDARQLFDKMSERNIISWNGIITGYVQRGHSQEALELFCQMRRAGMKPSQFTFTGVLKASATLAAGEHGRGVHGHSIKSGFKSDVFVQSALVDMYAKCECLEDARQMFDKMPERDVVAWNAMIAGYIQNDHGEEALKLYCQMQQADMRPNQFTFASILKACAEVLALNQGKLVHVCIIKSQCQLDVSVWNALLDMYGKCGVVENARHVFDKTPKRDAISWNAMLLGYAQNGHGQETLEHFRQMQIAGMELDQFTFTTVLKACDILSAMEQANQIHAHIIKTGFELDVFVGSAVIDMYAKSGNMEYAYRLFKKMPERDVVLWSVIIAGYAQHGHGKEALRLFYDMQQAGLKPDQFSLGSALRACASLAALGQGKQVHIQIIKNGFESDAFVCSGLVDMYAKCGSIEDASDVFEKMLKVDVASWNAMIGGHAQHGRGREALELFKEMQRTGVEPDHITFIGVLCACSHVGLVEEGRFYFDYMCRGHGITPTAEHYACMVDLLSRAGCLDEAECFINEMPLKPSAVVWRTLLAACRIHGRVELGERAAESLFELNLQDAGTYVLLSNLYAAVGRWNDVARVRNTMKERDLEKETGLSWIEVKKEVHVFLAGDRSHPQGEEIYAELERLIGKIKGIGYIPDVNYALHDVEYEQKERFLFHHSEKLAIAFGIISTPSRVPIRVVKNLRVCGDCHTAIKFISKIVGKEIVVRDSNRFHHFKENLCSCGDYW